MDKTMETEYWVPEHVREYLRSLGFVLPLEAMEGYIRMWHEWMQSVGSFYDYRDTDGFGRIYEVHRRSIHPAMRVCQEWGSLLLNDKTSVVCENQAATEWLDNFFTKTGFMPQAQNTVVRAFGMGTGAWALWIDADAAAALEGTGVTQGEAGARPWDSVKLQVKRVVIDSSFASVGITNCAYWFSGFTELVEVSGFENMSGITTATQMFSSCASLETIFATSFTNAVSSGSGMFYGCNNLVGGTDGFVPASTSAGSVCKLGTGGVLTDPNADMRDWCKVYVYSDGYVEFTAAGSADAQKTLLASGRLCVNAKYKAAGIIPGYSYRAQFRTVVFRSDMGTFSEINMNYWFYSLTAITSFVGIGNLANVHEMQFAFSSCQGVTELDFTGFDPSHLTNLYYCFGGCNALTTIYADSTWALPSSGVSGTQEFYNCQNLVGENGTVWASSNVGYSYFRIDRAGQAGYLTAA